MPSSKKRKLSKIEKKKMMAEKGKKSAESRGKGISSRQEFVLPAKWESEVKQGKTRQIVEYYSPGKTKYRTQSEVKNVLHQRGMALCFNESESPSEELSSSESDVYDPDKDLEHEGALPSTSKAACKSTDREKCLAQQADVEQRLFVCESSQVCKFVDDINRTSRCSTEECNGMYFCAFSI